ncbi:MAG: rhodanese-like domain-containing protein [Proteobacteria bacterium]|nr:rhodanese-like domain-containing protein [Pseudomonadota bacterium]
MVRSATQDWGPDIDVHDLAGLRAGGQVHTLLDVREPDEVAVCAIANSRFIPMQQIPRHVADLPREHPLVILCHHGTRSGMVADFLRGNGFPNVFNLAGGIDAWAHEIEPEMPRY